MERTFVAARIGSIDNVWRPGSGLIDRETNEYAPSELVRRAAVHWLVSCVQFLMVVIPYQREQRIAEKIKASGGSVYVADHSSRWLPAFIRDKLPFKDRITSIQSSQVKTEADFSEIGSLTQLTHLRLNNSHVEDADMEHLKGLTRLQHLDLSHTVNWRFKRYHSWAPQTIPL